MTSITPPANTAAISILVIIVANGAALDIAGCTDFTSNAIADGIAAGAARAGLSTCIGLRAVHRVDRRI